VYEYNPDTQYEELLRKIVNEGDRVPNRTGTDTLEIFGAQLRYDLQRGFPLITTKKVFTKAIIHELLWFLSGDTNVKYLQDNGVTIWDEWANEHGDLGPVYGGQWRAWGGNWKYDGYNDEWVEGEGIDQISDLIDGIKKDPHGRRHIVTAWNPSEIDKMALPPCHMFFQCHVDSDKRLSLQIYQRSADMFLGVPFNIASYALLTHMIAQQTGCTVGDLIWTAGSAHLYVNHLDAATRQLKREPYGFPTLALNDPLSIFDYSYEDIEVRGYQHHDAIKADVAI